MDSGTAIFPELVMVTFIGIRSSNFFTRADNPDPTTLIYPQWCWDYLYLFLWNMYSSTKETHEFKTWTYDATRYEKNNWYS